MVSIDKLMTSPSYNNHSKKERLTITRERAKLEKNLGSIADLNRLPAAIFIVDILKEHISLAEAKKLNIPTFAIVDTNSDPRKVDFPIPANDDASKSISIIIETMVNAIEEGLVERKLDRDKKAADEDKGEQDEDFEDRMKDDEIEEDVAGIKLPIKEHPDARLQKMKTGTAGESEEKKSQRKRINKPVGRTKK